MLKKVLVANRGEIARRVFHTARRLGIETVAVYSDADRHALHVAQADEAIHIGPAEAAQSYLNIDRIIEACLSTGADCVHPGYGFLSENPEFVERLSRAGLVFMGPSASSIRAMGLKDAAKKLMQQSGVPVVPGYHGDNQDASFLAGEADKIGYPVLIKARAGGGGKGMRLVEQPGQFESALASAQREAEQSFADPACLVEKYIQQPRHIEVQVFGDQHGNHIHLFERDCSLQRRHQKVIEEAPAPGMTTAMRQALGEAAVKASEAIDYYGAGTVEFIVDSSQGLQPDKFWFMEMNTRLQVEHPVTEAVTGLDLVELQFKVAAGEPLPLQQTDVKLQGHAFEARIYAEDVPRGFLPATGTLSHCVLPDAVAFERGDIRLDAAVGEGDDISPWYDPMIAKLIVSGDDRPQALQRLNQALGSTVLSGTVTNVAFLQSLASHGEFAQGNVDTGYIERHLDSLLAESASDLTLSAFAAVAAAGLLPTSEKLNKQDPFDTLASWRSLLPASRLQVLTIEGQERPYTVVSFAENRHRIEELDTVLQIDSLGSHRYRVTSAGGSRDLLAVLNNQHLTVSTGQGRYEFAWPDDSGDLAESRNQDDTVRAPMPGVLRMVSVKPGDSVVKDGALVVLEAMKMEHVLTAPRDGVIAEVLVSQGNQVTEGDVVVRFETESE